MYEILAPAGGIDSAYAAINAGADAIYLGLDKFSARSSAENFAAESFKNICAYAHAFGVKVYAALNTVVKDEELKSFFESVAEAWNGGADALILQDLYLGAFIKKAYPQIKLHLSTQAGVCNAFGAQIAKENGFDRVILARETKLDDVREISKIIETEVFVQGALCTCFSGQCYMSSFAGGNSGNRGKCKQPCRKLYSIDREGFDERAYRLSLSDLCVGGQIDKLIEAGAVSFKIEGRMRRPEYVSAAVRYYKKILSGTVTDGDFRDLKRTYNRGNYTKGLAFGQDKSFLSPSVQGHIGEFVGTVKVRDGKFVCLSGLKFSGGDGFKILREGKEVGGGIYGGEVKDGFIINSRDRLKNGDKVFVTTDVKLSERLLSDRRRIPLIIEACFFVGKLASVTVNGVEYFGDEPLSAAKTQPLTAEDVKRCFAKTDSYPFEPSFGKIQTDGVFIAASSLNSLRRRIYADYFSKISSKKERVGSPYLISPSDFKLIETAAAYNGKTAAICTDLRGVKADVGILKLRDFSDFDPRLTDNFKGEKFLYVPPYLSGKELADISAIAARFDGVYCDNYFGAELARRTGKSFFAGSGFNITNRISLGLCKARYVCISKELTLKEAEPLSAENAFYLAGGDVKVMDLIYCPFGKKCATCDRRDLYTLTDAEGRKFPLRRYRASECRFEVYNCANLVCDCEKFGKLYDFTLEDAAALSNDKNREKYYKNVTRGHSLNGIY